MPHQVPRVDGQRSGAQSRARQATTFLNAKRRIWPLKFGKQKLSPTIRETYRPSCNKVSNNFSNRASAGGYSSTCMCHWEASHPTQTHVYWEHKAPSFGPFRTELTSTSMSHKWGDANHQFPHMGIEPCHAGAKIFQQDNTVVSANT